MRIIFFVFIYLLLISCERFDEKGVYGYYAPENYKNTFDTIQIKSDGIYHRKVYDKNKKLVLEINGKWIYKAPNRISIDDFYLNLDDDLIKYPNAVRDTDFSMSTYFEEDGLGIKFCVGYHEGQNCYRKIK